MAEPVDLRLLLERFAELTLEATGAFRATVFLVDEGDLVPLAVRSREPDAATQLPNCERALTLGSIPLDEVPQRRALLEAGRPVAIPDAAASELVPDAWAALFDVRALIVAPLVAGGEPLGLLVADWKEAVPIPDHLVEVVGAIAGSLALAVHNAVLVTREAERSDALRVLLEATTVLRSSAGLEPLAEHVTEPLARALGATGVSVCLLEDHLRYRTLAAWNPPIPKRGSLRTLSRTLAQRVSERWQHGAQLIFLTAEEMAPVAPGLRAGSAIVLPLATADDSLLGFVLVRLAERQAPTRALELAGALASHLAAAIERAHLRETLALETERLRGLCALWGFEAEPLEAYAAAIEEAIGPALGFTVVRVSVADAELRELGYFAEPDDLDEQLMHHWARRARDPREPLPARTPGELAAPLTVHGRVVGVVRVRDRQGGLSQREVEMLDALAAAFGRAIEKEMARREARRKELDLALAEERERVAARLHDTVGRLLYALNLRAATLRLAAGQTALADEARQIEALARSGLQGLRRAVATLASMRMEDRGLVASLERLAADFQEHHDTVISLAVDAADRSLPPKVEEVLIQVAQEALSNVERHAQASSVTISLDVRDDEVVLRIRDDGLGLGRSSAPPGAGLGLELSRRLLEPFGGRLELVDRSPGVEVIARVPAPPHPLRVVS